MKLYIFPFGVEFLDSDYKFNISSATDFVRPGICLTGTVQVVVIYSK
jgi:hypothetical protein